MKSFVRVPKTSLILMPLVFFSFAVEAADYWSPRTAALGGAGTAAPLLTDSLVMNPAMASFIAGYTGSFSFTTFSGPNDSEPKGRIRHISVIDSTNPDFQSGFGITQNPYGKLYNGILSRKLSENLSVGAGIKHAGGSGSKASITNFSVGSVFSPMPLVTLGLLIDNVKENNTSLQWNAYRAYTLGMKANLEKILMVYVDPSYAPTRNKSFGYSAGLELPVMKDAFLRMGRSQDVFQPVLGGYGTGVGFGVGAIFPKFGFDFAHFRTTAPTVSQATSLALSATF